MPLARTSLRLLALTALWLGLGACGRGPARPAPAVHTVTIEAMRFTPEQITVRRGDTVVWVNKDMFPHSATAAGTFDSQVIAIGQSWSRQFTAAGEFPYLCSLHPPMTGTVRVSE
jgi:plastocyanin